MERQYIAYLLIVLLMGAAAGAIAYFRHNSRERVYLREKMRQKEAHRRALAGDDIG